MVKRPVDAVHTRRPRWHLTLRAADLEEGAKERYHHGDRGGRKVSAREMTESHGVTNAAACPGTGAQMC